MKLKVNEHTEEKQLTRWVLARAGLVRELELLFAIPNGGRRDSKERVLRNGTIIHYSPAGRRLREEGVLPGVPDRFLPLARNGFNGLFIEMKAKGGKCSPEQLTIHMRLRQENFCVCVCYGWEEAARVLENYIGCMRTV
jgi:hypothetical protein